MDDRDAAGVATRGGQAATLRDAGECARETLDLPGARPEGHGSYSEGPGRAVPVALLSLCSGLPPPHDNPDAAGVPLEEWQAADRRDAGECARETVDLINRVLECVDAPRVPLREVAGSRPEGCGECARETVDLINCVLDLAKLQAGRLQLEALPLFLPRLVQQAVCLLPHKTRALGVWKVGVCLLEWK
ncbi:unnamed protein product [Closterium sp. NIES-65]|nr:unnamed protein product [Closterium sp. NIES-65]